MAVITIPVNEETAKLYAAASAQEQEKMRLRIDLLIRQMADPSKDSLAHMMDIMSENAQKRGLTPEILEELLKDDSDE